MIARPKAAPTRESQIEAYLVKCVKALGGEVRKVKWIGRTGAPDRLVMLPERTELRESVVCPGVMMLAAAGGGNCIWVELKAPGLKAQPHQAREHERMRKMGQRVEVVDSYERVEEVLS